MAKKRYINTKFWSDTFIVELNPLDRYLFLYLLTNEHTDICGIYELPWRVMARETGLDDEMLKKMFIRLEGKANYIDGWVHLTNFVKHQAVNPKVEEGIKRSISEVPREIMAVIKEKGIGYDSLCIGSELLNLTLTKPKGVSDDTIPSKTKKLFTNQYRERIGKEPLTPRKMSDKQKETIEAFKTGIGYFKEIGYSMHGMMFMEVSNEKRNSIVRKLVIEAQSVLGSLNPLIDWWFKGNGEWADYEPEQCFSVKTIEKFKNSNKVKRQGTW